MFEHLDDPQRYTPPAGLRTAVRAHARRRRQRRAAVVGGVASVAALGIGTVTAARARLEPERIEVGGLADEATSTDGTGPVVSGDPVTVLVVGTDRSAIDEDPGRADTIALVRVDPAAGEIRLLGAPRDLILGTDAGEMPARAAFTTGGPTQLIRSLDADLGVSIDHYVQVDFAGAVELVDALGGIRVAVDRAIRDEPTGTLLMPGCQELDGEATLGLGRARRVEVQADDGSWRSDGTSAIGRDLRGAAVAAALLQAVGRVGPGDLPGLVRAGLGAVAVDADLDAEGIVAWAREGSDDRFVPLGLPVVAGTVDGGEVLRLGEGAADVVDVFLDGSTDPIPTVVDGTPVTDPTGLRPC